MQTTTTILPDCLHAKPDGQIDLSPGDIVGPSIALGTLPADSYVVALYDLANGPDANMAYAAQFGQMVFAESTASIIAPEPASLVVLGTAVIGLARPDASGTTRPNDALTMR
jgi:hypothetical protein